MRRWSVLLVAASLPARADTLFVNTTGVSPFDSIQAAIDSAEDGERILVFPGTYGPIDLGEKELVIHSIGGPEITTIDASGGPSPAVIIDGQQSEATLLAGFSLTGGTGFADTTTGLRVGGGLYVAKDARPRIAGNIVWGNSADLGGGIGVIDASPVLMNNDVQGNVAAVRGGGLWIEGSAIDGSATSSGCDLIRGNTGAQVGGVYVGDAPVAFWNPIVSSNLGERGGFWFGIDAAGFLRNGTVVANQGNPSSAGGIELEGDGLTVSNTLVQGNVLGLGVLRTSGTAAWTWNDVIGNPAGEYGGPPGDPTGNDGNVSVPGVFQLFTPQDPLDDLLSLSADSPLLDLGDPDPASLDLDGSRCALGADGGPRSGCDLDGDGVRPSDVPGDCRPTEAAFHPDAYEVEGGLDSDCDGWGTLERIELVLDDGAFLPSGGGWGWEPPVAVPGRGWIGENAWCTGCAAPAGASLDTTLERSFDLSTLPFGAPTRLLLIHAWQGDGELDGGIVQRWDGTGWVGLLPQGGYPGALDPLAPGNALAAEGFTQAWSGESDGYQTDSIRLDPWTGGTVLLRLRYATSSLGTATGWTLGRAALQVQDADGDARAAVLADCNDSDVSIYVGAVEVPYDGIDQDCDGQDEEDWDGDGFIAGVAGGDDCDDDDPTVHPGAAELPYDGIDQDCDGDDLRDVDGDGYDGWAAGGPDCDDGAFAIHPDAIEVPYDQIDQDCDGDDLLDVDGDGWEGAGEPPALDCDDNDPAIHPGAEDTCGNGIDDNCDGAIDFQLDGDGDGQDPCSGDCDDQEPTVHSGAAELCDGLDTDCDLALDEAELDGDGDGLPPCAGDCDDGDDAVGLFADICDGLDNDCDGVVDEGHDLDGDGFDSCSLDCDDARAYVHPGADPVCDEAIDADCDGTRDDEGEACRPAGCAACGTVDGEGAPTALALALLALRRPRQRPFSTQPAPDKGSPPGNSPGSCPAGAGHIR